MTKDKEFEVNLPNGCHLYRTTNRAGGRMYISDEIGGGLCVWDTSLIDESTLLTALVEEHRRRREERFAKKRRKIK